MPTQVKKYLSSITIGIRFGPSFSIVDDLGEIIDQILYDEGSFFNKKVFPNVTSLPFQIRLENPKTGDYLSISQQDLILCINFDDTVVKSEDINPKMKFNNLNEIHENFRQLLDTMREYDFDRIQRLGYVNKYVFNVDELTKSVTDTIIGNKMDGLSDMALQVL